MNILIYENNLNGHRLEYIHHLYDLAIHIPEHNFRFILHNSFSQVKSLFQWEKADNVSIEICNIDERQLLGRRETLKEMRQRSKSQANSINHYIDKYNIDHIIAITIIHYIPFLYNYLRKGITIDGILYSIFPSSNRDFPYRYVDYIKYALFNYSSRFKNVYVLNDRDDTNRLNHFFHSSKFKYIPDPFIPLDTTFSEDLHNSLYISQEKIVFLHFGGLQERKGTMLIMDSIRLLSQEERTKYTFIFAGKVYNDIKERFYKAYNELKDKVQLIVMDEFCSYEYLASLCKTCDCILIPYLSTMQSSGVIGYASQFEKPVISPSSGLIGRLVKEYKLGYLLNSVDPKNLIKAYKEIAEGKIEPPTNEYCIANTVQNFQNIIKNGFQKD